MHLIRSFSDGRNRGSRDGRPTVMVVGPNLGAAGGVAVVLETLLASGLADRFELLHVVTHRDTGRVGKALSAFAGLTRAAWLLGTRRVDIVYLLTSSGFSLRRKAAVAMLARLARRPYVIHVHASNFDGYYSQAARWEQRLVRRTLSSAALAIAVSPSWEERLRALAPCRTTAIPNPVPIPSQPAGLNSLTGPHRQPGPSWRPEGIANDRAGARDTQRTSPGRSSGAPQVTAICRRSTTKHAGSGVSDRVDLPGWIGPEERARTLRTASVFTLPSRDEGLPVALLEAMAYGLPAVVSPVGGIPDAFEDGRHGYFVPPDDPDALADLLGALLADPERARWMGTQARADAERRYATDIVAALVGDALQSVLAHRRADERL